MGQTKVEITGNDAKPILCSVMAKHATPVRWGVANQHVALGPEKGPAGLVACCLLLAASS